MAQGAVKRVGVILLLWAGPAGAGHELENRDLTNGATLYAQHCAACHGTNLEGQPDWRSPGPDGILPAPPHDRTGHTWHHSNAMLFDYTKLGGQSALAALGVKDFTSGMPAFQDVMSDQDIWDILGYIRSTWPAREQAVQSGQNPQHD
jgi:mono/diheme cytochrome c family protein